MSFDTDKNGTITIDELKKGLEKKGAGATSNELTELMKSMDVDGRGRPDVARHVIQRTFNPRLLNYIAPCDVASNIRPALLPGPASWTTRSSSPPRCP